MKKIILYILLIIAFRITHATEFSVYEANYPNVKDYNVNIDDIVLIIKPAGVYVEINLYMTVSYDFQSWFFKNYNELEFKWQFNLPQDAIVHEFCYWEGDSIIYAKMLDKWTAELLFSDVSVPVRNPALLVQSIPNNDGQVVHELRLFPIKRNEKRKFKIQYLLPGRPTGENLRVWLPMTQLISKNTPPPKKLKILYEYGNEPYEPKLIGTEVLLSKNLSDISSWELEIPVSENQFVEMELPSPIKKDVFFSTYTKNGEHFYHLAVKPPQIQKISKPRKILFVIDFNRFNTNNLDGDFLLSYLKESLLQALTESDSINVLIAYDEYVLGSNKWVACTKDGIDKLFQKIMMRSFPSYNNLLPLISKAVEFINSQNDFSEVLFITNINTINLYGESKEQLAYEIIDKFKKGTKIHIFDLDNKSYLIWSNDDYETPMQSFYGIISYATSGNLFFLRYNSLKEMLFAFLYEDISHFESVEVQMRYQDGYAHSKHFIALHEGYYPINTPIMQIGKFSGNFPVDITVFGKYKTTNEKYSITLTENDIVQGSELVATTWYGKHIQSLLKLPYDPITISNIIDLGIEENILTPYTGFLVFNLEAGQGTNASQGRNGENDGSNTDVNEESKEDSLNFAVKIFPNPFNPSTTINFNLPANGKVIIRVYNILGEIVNELINEEMNAGNHSIIFNGANLSSGIYILIISFEGGGKSYFAKQKLLLMK